LRRAIKTKKTEIALELIKGNIFLEFVDERGIDYLRLSILNNNKKVFNALIEKGAAINKTIEGKTTMEWVFDSNTIKDKNKEVWINELLNYNYQCSSSEIESLIKSYANQSVGLKETIIKIESLYLKEKTTKLESKSNFFKI